MEGVQSWGAHIGCSSTADNLFIDGMVTCHNLSMAWISVYHGWLKGVMLLHRFSVWLCRLITAKLCRSWNTRVMFVARKREGNPLTNNIQQRVAPRRCAMPKSVYCMLKPNRVEGQCYRGINIQGLFQKLANEGQMGPVLWFLRGPFSRKGIFGLIGTDCSMRKQTFIDALLPFLNILGNWKSLGLNYCRIPDVCLVK